MVSLLKNLNCYVFKRYHNRNNNLHCIISSYFCKSNFLDGRTINSILATAFLLTCGGSHIWGVGVFTYLFTFVESFVGGEYIIYLMEHVLYGAHILVLSGFYMIFVWYLFFYQGLKVFLLSVVTIRFIGIWV